MSSSETDGGPPCKRDKKTLDLNEEEGRSDSIPHPVVPLSIRDIRLDLNLIPDTVILETMKLVSNQDRRELSFTCRRFRNMIIKNKTPEMDRRKIIDWMEISCNLCSPSLVIFLYGSHYVHKSFEDFPAFEDFVKRLGAFYVYNKWLNVFFEYPQMEELEVYHSYEDHGYPQDIWDEYCSTVTQKATEKGIDVRTVEKDGYWTCKKLTENGKEIVEISGNQEFWVT